MNARDRILNRVDEATRATKDAIAKAKAEARANGETFDLAKFHADREKAVSAERDTARFGKSFEGQGTRPGSREIRRKKAQLKGRRARGQETPEDIENERQETANDEKSGLDPKTGQRIKPMTGPQKGGRKRSIRTKLKKGPSKPMNLPDHNEGNYTDEEIVNLIMTESYLSLFSSLK